MDTERLNKGAKECMKNEGHKNGSKILYIAVLRIHKILVRIPIRIRGSIPLTMDADPAIFTIFSLLCFLDDFNFFRVLACIFIKLSTSNYCTHKINKYSQHYPPSPPQGGDGFDHYISLYGMRLYY
jgi:hypothetical protein